ncbi:MAG TPA: metallophosphoesterase [Thermoanaerobaculia bacterium]|nr:metallophosphoesterase [Thermoanaerobaculia bacterium]
MKNGISAILVICLASCSSTSSVGPEASPPAPLAAVPGDICDQLQTGNGMGSAPPEIPVTGRLRVLAFGDFGTGSADQKRVARGIARQTPYHFGLTLGDNFYRRGLNSPTHPRWQSRWEDLYSSLGIRVYATLGNHDYLDTASPAAEIARSSRSRTWCLPRPSYTFVAGPVQFFAVDTDPIEKGLASVPRELDWLKNALAASTAPWKLVYGHHPVYTNGDHGGQRGFLPELKDQLLPVLQDEKVDVYLAGHDHDLQALKPDGGVWFFVSGGGGQDTRPLRTAKCRQWAESMHGFTVLEADEETLTMSFFNADGEPVQGGRVELRKGSPAPDCPR